MTLIDMKPHGDLTSTGYALANPGKEYLVLQPSVKADVFTVKLATGTYEIEWYNVNNRETAGAGKLAVKSDENHSFTSPFPSAGPSVLYLRHMGP
jgi:hypothetical protein